MTVVDTLAERLVGLQQRIATACARVGRNADSVTLLPVSKTFDAAVIRAATTLGLRRFGENRTQEIRQKAAELFDQTLDWILIGPLQTNKARDAVSHVVEVQSLDRLELAQALERRLCLTGRTLDVLVQVKTSPEPSKHGLSPAALPGFLRTLSTDFPTLRVQGLMTVATHSPDPAQVRSCFRTLRQLRDRMRSENLPNIHLDRLSMGMSNDFETAIEEGSTEVRIGSALFGSR